MLSVRSLLTMAKFGWSSIDSRCRKLLLSPFRTMQAFRKRQISSPPRFWYPCVRVDLDSNFMLKALLIKFCNSWFNEKTVNLVFLASKGIPESYLLLFELREPCPKLALGQNCIKIISDKSNSVAMFLRIQTDIYIVISLFSVQTKLRVKRPFKKAHQTPLTVKYPASHATFWWLIPFIS